MSTTEATRSSSSNSSTSPSLYTWGTNKNGCLFQPSTEKIAWEPQTPKNLSSVSLSSPIKSVVCGATDTALVLEDGGVYVAGQNKSGQLGVGHTRPVEQLTSLSTEKNNLPPIEKIALGQKFGAAITKEGDLYSFGSGGSVISGMGYLGHGNAESCPEPKLVESLVEDGCLAKDVVLGESHMTVLTTEGEVLTTGASSYGRLGNGESGTDQLYLEPVEILREATQIAGGKAFTLALDKEGVVHAWGRNHKGQLGVGFGMAVDMYSMEEVPVPIDSDELMNRTVTKIAAGNSHAACISSSGELFTWGSNFHLEPVRVSEVLHTKIVDVVCGDDYTLALSEDSQLYVWGKGKTGVLGVGSDSKSLNQAKMIKTLADQKVVQISAGWSHAACLVHE